MTREWSGSVWCEAPNPAPVSPWKYSENTTRSCHAGSVWNRSTSPSAGRRPLCVVEEQPHQPPRQVVGDRPEVRPVTGAGR